MSRAPDAEAPMHRDPAGRRMPRPEDARNWLVYGREGTNFPRRDGRIQERSILTLRDGVAVLSGPIEPFNTMWIIPYGSISCIEALPDEPSG